MGGDLRRAVLHVRLGKAAPIEQGLELDIRSRIIDEVQVHDDEEESRRAISASAPANAEAGG